MEKKGVRLDKFLWSVRLFKTRSLASEACRSGKVKLGDVNAKPARLITIGDRFSLRKGLLLLQFEVIQELGKRVGAKLVPEYLKDLTPESEYAKLDSVRNLPSAFRDPGAGRPTKKDRRELDRWQTIMDDFDEDWEEE
jgi:ribosome-associated heat shock protein Hsp15